MSGCSEHLTLWEVSMPGNALSILPSYMVLHYRHFRKGRSISTRSSVTVHRVYIANLDNLETSLSVLSRTSRQAHEPGPHALHVATLSQTLLHELRTTSGLGLICQTPSLLSSMALAWKFLLSSAPNEEGSWFWEAASCLAATWAMLVDGLGKMEWDPLARRMVRELKAQSPEIAALYVQGRLTWVERTAGLEEDEEMDVDIEVKDWVLPTFIVGQR
jgi:hypothetical protein